MTDSDTTPIACSLGGGELRERLVRIAALGARSLISHRANGGTHVLRFRGGAETRGELEEIVAAEAGCCPFLELSIDSRDSDLVLSISAPRDAEPAAKALALAFGSASDIDHSGVGESRKRARRPAP